MFFKKKYHTLVVKHKKFSSLNDHYLFTGDNIDALIKVLEILYIEKDWDCEVRVTLSDRKLSSQKLLAIYNTFPDNKKVEKVPFELSDKVDVYDYLNKVGRFRT